MTIDEFKDSISILSKGDLRWFESPGLILWVETMEETQKYSTGWTDKPAIAGYDSRHIQDIIPRYREANTFGTMGRMFERLDYWVRQQRRAPQLAGLIAEARKELL